MIDADALHEAEQQALGQLAQMDLSLAARLHERAMAAEEPKEIAEFTRSYQRASRCVRQTIMLRAKLRHERDRHLAATAPAGRAAAFAEDDEAPDPVELRIDRRIMDLQEAASRIAAKASPDMPRRERLDALDRIDGWIDQETLDQDDDFGAQDLDEHVLDLCRACDLPEALGRRFRDLPRAPWQAENGDVGNYIFEPGAEPPFEPERRDTG